MKALAAIKLVSFFIVLGVLHSLSFSSVLPSFFNFLSLLVLWWYLNQLTIKKALIATAIFYTTHFVASLSWLFVYASVFGAANAFLSFTFLSLFSLYLSLFYLLAVYVFKKIAALKCAQPPSPYLLTLLLPMIWLVADYLRGHSFPSFPWVLTGYAYQPSDLFMSITQLSMFVPLVGVYGFGFVLYVLMGCLLAAYQYFAQRQKHLALRPLLVIVIMIGFSWLLYAIAQPTRYLPQPHLFTQQTQHKLSLALVQDYVKPNESFSKQGMSDQETQAIYQSYIDLIKNTPADLLVLPETTLPLPWSQTPEHLKQALITQKKADVLLLGSVMMQIDTNLANQTLASNAASIPSFHLTNSVIAIQSDTAPSYQYNKIERVPIAEFMPAGWSWLIQWFNLPYGSFEPGAINQAPLTINKKTIVPSICYEFLFGDRLAERLRESTQTEPRILINLSDLAWFGDGIMLDHVDHIITMRAMEFETPFLIATKTGPSNPSFLIDFKHKNQLINHPKKTEVKTREIAAYQGNTPYLRLGNSSLIVLALALLLLQILMFRFFTFKNIRFLNLKKSH